MSIGAGDKVMWEPSKKTKLGETVGELSARGKITLVHALLQAVDYFAGK